MATDSNDVDKLQSALNDAAGKASILWTTFVTFELYLVIAFGSVTHRNLFLEDPIKLPLLNVDLPLVGFFLIAPAILVIFHFYVLLQLLAMARKTRDYDTVLRKVAPAASDHQLLRQRLDPFLILQFLAGPTEQRTGFSGLSLRLIAWITLAGAPVLILLQGQVTFLPYHGIGVTWFQRIAILIDLVLIWYFWNSIRSNDVAIFRRVPSFAWHLVAGVASFIIFIFSVCIATFPGEPANEYLRLLREPLFAVAIDEVNGRPLSLFSNRLVLTDQSFVDANRLDKAEVSRSLRGRDLTGAVLNRSDLRNADFTGAMLNNARLEGARLQRAQFSCEQIDAKLGCASLLGASLKSAELQGASLVGALLSGATLDRAELYGASLILTQMQGASLKEAKLQGVSFLLADLRGATLDRAQLQGASLRSTQLQGASLKEAQLQGAEFDRAFLAGVSLRGAGVWRVRGTASIYLADVADLDSKNMPWTADLASNPQQHLTFATWRDAVLKQIPPGPRHDDVAVRLSALDPAPENEPKNTISVKFWEALGQGKNDNQIADFLADLACDNDKWVARGLIQNGRIRSMKAFTLVADRLRKGKFDPSSCPAVMGFTEADWSTLDALVSKE